MVVRFLTIMLFFLPSSSLSSLLPMVSAYVRQQPLRYLGINNNIARRSRLLFPLYEQQQNRGKKGKREDEEGEGRY
jgi:hypothetical protein